MFLYLRGESQQAYNLGNPGAGAALPAGDFRLFGNLTGLQESLPLDSLAEEFDYSGGLGFSGRFVIAPARRDCGHGPVGRHPAVQVELPRFSGRLTD